MLSERPFDSLSPRQREVLHLVCVGYTDPQIARELGIGIATARTYIRAARDRLHLVANERSRRWLLNLAYELGYDHGRAAERAAHREAS